jgi:hypothetical protein
MDSGWRSFSVSSDGFTAERAVDEAETARIADVVSSQILGTDA